MKKMLVIISLLMAHLGFSSIAIAGKSTQAISAVRQNELLYFIKQDCGSCHGMTLKGGLGPALLPQTLAAKPEGYLVNTILEGRPDTAMPPWKSMLTREEAIWITNQLQQGLIPQTELAGSSLSSEDQPEVRP